MGREDGNWDQESQVDAYESKFDMRFNKEKEKWVSTESDDCPSDEDEDEDED